MAERRENSVLFSLSELRRIEEDRIKQEEVEAEARVAAERKAREDEQRRARETEEAKRREGEELAMRERLEREKMGREDQLRLDEAERRARVEADHKLQEQRLHLDFQARQASVKHPPIKAIVWGVVILFGAVGGLGYYMYTQSEADKAQQQALLKENEVKLRQAQEDRDKTLREAQAIKKEIEQLDSELRSAKTAAEREAIQRKMQGVREKQKNLARTSTTSSPGQPKINLGGNDNDPLKGL